MNTTYKLKSLLSLLLYLFSSPPKFLYCKFSFQFFIIMYNITIICLPLYALVIIFFLGKRLRIGNLGLKGMNILSFNRYCQIIFLPGYTNSISSVYES